MQIEIDGHSLEVTEAIKNYVEKKLEKLDHKTKIMSAHIHLKVEKKFEHHAAADVHIKGTNIEASATAEDLYAAIDAMIDKLSRQLIKYKETH